MLDMKAIIWLENYLQVSIMYELIISLSQVKSRIACHSAVDLILTRDEGEG
jgi:hypothetical protein